jgi:hypothetical protein
MELRINYSNSQLFHTFDGTSLLENYLFYHTYLNLYHEDVLNQIKNKNIFLF